MNPLPQERAIYFLSSPRANWKCLFVPVLVFETCIEMHESTFFYGPNTMARMQPCSVSASCPLLSSASKPAQARWGRGGHRGSPTGLEVAVTYGKDLVCVSGEVSRTFNVGTRLNLVTDMFSFWDLQLDTLSRFSLTLRKGFFK